MEQIEKSKSATQTRYSIVGGGREPQFLLNDDGDTVWRHGLYTWDDLQNISLDPRLKVE